MKEIELVLADPKDATKTTSLFYTLTDTPIASKYFESLRETIERRIPILDPDRFYNFPHDHRDRHWIADQLNRRITIINANTPGLINRKAEAHMDQDTMNHLHRFFEDYRGGVLCPAEYFQSAPPQVQRALEEYNLLIHRYEDFKFNERKLAAGRKAAAKLVLTFEYARSRHDLADEDYDHFTRVITFGGWYINYCEVGKQLWDVYLDKDEVIGDQNIRPLRYYSADAMIEFSPTTPMESRKKEMDRFWEWWDTKAAHLESLGFRKYDKKLSIGLLPVAFLNREKGPIAGFDDDQIVDWIGRYQFMAGVRVHDL